MCLYRRYSHFADGVGTLTVKYGETEGALELETVSSVQVVFGRWFQANQIHRWFVENVQRDVDNEAEYYVAKEQLAKLLGRVHEVLEASKLVQGEMLVGYSYDDAEREPIFEHGLVIEDPTVAKALLPTQGGFFLGRHGYDEEYIQDLVATKDILTRALAVRDNSTFYYRAKV